MRFRFWRSKAFWLGLPGLLFLAWGWWHSMGHDAWITLIGPDVIVVSHSAGEVVYSRRNDVNSARWDLTYGNKERTAEEMRDVKADAVKVAEYLPNHHISYIPYPYLLLTYLAVWGGVLVWRGRRFRKAAGRSAGFHPQP